MKPRKSDTWVGGTFKLAAGALSAGAALVSILSYTSAYSPLSSQAHRLAVTPVRDTATSIGDTLQLAAIATDDRGAALTGVTPSWTSADPQIAVVDQAGTVVSRGPGRDGDHRPRGRARGAGTDRRGAARRGTHAHGYRAAGAGGGTPSGRVSGWTTRGVTAIRGATVRWEAGDAAVATVDSAGEVAGVSPGRSSLTATFDQLRATLPVEVVPVPASITVVAGEDQRAPAGKSLAAPISAQVVSRTGRPVAGVPVSLVLRSAQGTVQPEVDTSDARGMVQATWTLGAVPGRQQLALQVEGVSVSPVLTAEADPVAANTRVAMVEDTLSAQVGDSLAEPVVIRVTDSLGLALADVPVTWSTPDGGAVTGLGTRTDSLGEARARWVLGPKAGRQRVRAQVGNARLVPPFTGHATARAGAAVSVAIRGGDRQSGTVGKALAQPIVVRALDRHGNAVAGASIAVTAAAGRAADTLITTDSAGLGRIQWTLGQTAGSQRLAVRVAGRDSAVEATARARAGNPVSMKFITASATTGKSTAKPVVVEVADAYGNPVADRTVTFSPTGGTLSSARVVTNSSGRASVVWKVAAEGEAGQLSWPSWRDGRARDDEGSPVALSELFAHDLDDHPLPPLPVPLPVEHPLPGPEVELPVRDRHDHLVAHREAAQVGRRVVLPGLVVPVAARVPRRDRLLQPFQDVLPEPRLVIVDEHRSADVHRRDEHEALANPARTDLLLDLVGDVDDLLALLGLEPEVVRVGGHRVT